MTSPPQGPGQEGSDEPREPSDEQPQGGTSGEPQDGSAAAAGESGSDQQSSGETTGQSGEQSAADAEETAFVPAPSAQSYGAQEGSGSGASAGYAEQSSATGEQSEGKKKSKKPLVIVGVVVLVVVLAGAGAAAWAFLGGNSAQQAAERYVELSTRETQDPKSVKADDYREVVCSQAMPQIEQVQKEKDQFLQQASPEDLDQLKQVKTTLKGVEENGDSGKATIETSMPKVPPQSVDLKLMKEEGDWKLCG